MITAIASIAVVALILTGWRTHRFFRYWRELGVKLSTESGFTAERLTFFATALKSVIARIVAVSRVGRFHIEGAEHLRRTKGRIILTPNHTIEHDAIVAARLLGMRPWRFFTAINQVTPARAMWLAWAGCISINATDMRKAVAGLKAAIRVMIEEAGLSFLIFPPGRLVEGGLLERKDFQPGAIKIAQSVQERVSEQVSIIPVIMTYDTDRRNATVVTRILEALGFNRSFAGKTVYGVHVLIGEPIPAASLPAKADEANDVLYARMSELLQRARSKK